MTHIVLIFFLIALWLVNTAPVFNFPLTPELWAAACGLMLARAHTGAPLSGSLGLWRSWLQDKRGSFFFFSALSLLLLTGCRALIAFFGHKAWSHTCSAMPGLIQKIECAFQAGTDQNYALRTFSYVVAASFLFFGAYSASLRGFGKKLPSILAGVTTLFAALCTYAFFTRSSNFLPEYILLNEFKWLRMTSLMQNPTWVWPFLTPGVLCLIYLSKTARCIWRRIIFLGATALCIWVAVKTQQRGAIFLVLALGCSWLISAAINSLQASRSKWGIAIVLLACIGTVTIALTNFIALGEHLASLGFGNRFRKLQLVSDSRLQIWKSAWLGIKDHLFFGHGYGSWYEKYGVLALKNQAPLLDTAHNYFIQSFFELGFVATFLNLTVLISGIYFSLKLSRDLSAQRRQLIYSIPCYLAILAVQEFDFIRSAYYMHALYWGWLLGFGPGVSSESNLNAAALNEDAPERLKKSARTLFVIGSMQHLRWAPAMLFLLGLGFLNWFSLSGFQYEANVHSRYRAKVRWLRAFGTMTFIRPLVADEQVYALYEFGKATVSGYQLSVFGAVTPFYSSFKPPNTYYLPIAARGFFSLPDLYKTKRGKPDFGRAITGMLFWPPHETKLPLLYSSGLTKWESSLRSSDQKVAWCATSCQVKLLNCKNNAAIRSLTLAAMRPDVSEAMPLIVTVTIKQRETGNNATELVFRNPEQHLSVPIPRDADIAIMTSSTYLGATNIPLGVQLVSASCSHT